MKFYIVKNDVQQGPFEVSELVIQGLAPDTLVWTKGMPEWVEASTVPELAQAIVNSDDDPGTPPAVPVRESVASAPAPIPAPVEHPAEPVETTDNNRATRALVGILVAVVVLALLMFTKPSRERHLNAIATACTEYLSDEVDDSPLAISGVLAEGTKSLGRDAIEGYLDYHLTIDDYFIFNVSKVSVGAKKRTASVGFLGMVFTFDKDDVAEAVEKQLGPKTVTEHVTEQIGKVLGDDDTPAGQKPDTTALSQKLDSVGRSVANKVADKVMEKGKEMVNDAVDQLLDQIDN